MPEKLTSTQKKYLEERIREIKKELITKYDIEHNKDNIKKAFYMDYINNRFTFKSWENVKNKWNWDLSILDTVTDSSMYSDAIKKLDTDRIEYIKKLEIYCTHLMDQVILADTSILEALTLLRQYK